MANSVTTTLGRSKLAQARSGNIALPQITHMAFGSGGVDAENVPIQPLESNTTLGNELTRKPISSYSFPVTTTCTYRCVLEKAELVDENINEIALIDEDGDLIAIKTFTNKTKDADMEMVFEINDVF